jgi:hypothetical protein
MPADLDVDSVGPVDVAVILFEGNKFSGDVAPALAELNDSGTVRIIDFAFVRKETDGSASVVEAGDAEVAEQFDFHATQFDLLSEEDLIGIADGLEAGSSAGDRVGEQVGCPSRGGGPRLPWPADLPGQDPPRDCPARHR